MSKILEDITTLFEDIANLFDVDLDDDLSASEPLQDEISSESNKDINQDKNRTMRLK